MVPLLAPRFALVALLALALSTCAPAAPAARPAEPAAPGSAPTAAPAPRPAAKPALGPDYFAGKVVTVLVNYSAGGISDVFGRTVARHLANHIPGRPTLVVENRPGAGGAVGANYLYNVAKKDGLTIGTFSAFLVRQMLGTEGTQYDVSRFHWLGGVGEPNFDIAHQSLGVRSAQDLARTSSEVVVGGLAPDSPSDMHMRTFLNLLGVRYRYVTGYPGFPEVRLAFQRGEVNYRADGLTGWFTYLAPQVQEGTVVPIAQVGTIRGSQVVRDPRISDLPTHFEIAAELRGPDVRSTVEYRALTVLAQMGALLRGVLLPPGTDPAIVETLRKAVADTFADAEFHADIEKQAGYRVEFIPGEEAQALAERIIRDASTDREAMDYLIKLTKEKD